MKSDLKDPGKNLEIRTFEFGKKVVNICRNIEKDYLIKPILS